ncbi:hypothetical protein MXB_1594 [Myxobolus squamalis]|nr:hypothetical protein MXB_1594 [Myxobolus squamalis]
MYNECLVSFFIIGLSFLLKDAESVVDGPPIVVLKETIDWCSPNSRDCRWESSKAIGNHIWIKVNTPLQFITQEISFNDRFIGITEKKETTLCPSIENPDCSLTTGSVNVLASSFTIPEDLKWTSGKLERIIRTKFGIELGRFTYHYAIS